jgi:phosphate transport system protein
MGTLHTDREYEHELDELRQRLLLMGARVEEMIRRALDAFARRDISLALSTIELDEEVDSLEKDIDQLCIRVLALRQPVASDLRFVTTALKIVTDIERIGDLAVNVCERLIELKEPLPDQAKKTLLQMGQIATEMVEEGLDALIDGNATRAQAVIMRDTAVDLAYAGLFPELLTHMAEPHSVHNAQRLQSIGKSIERIADHATNIAEMVVFMVCGQDPRHPHALR